MSTALVSLSIPDGKIGFVFHRLVPEDDCYTIREVRILELLWPTLVQTLHAILANEELNRYRSFADSLAAGFAPIALIHADGRWVYRNASYAGLFANQSGNRLPDYLFRLIKPEISGTFSEKSVPVPVEIPYFRFDRRTFRITLAKVEVNNSNETLWLLRMERISDGYSKMMRLLQEKGLSAREIEICLLLKEGLETRLIAIRLCVSYNTIRNHLQSIFKKTGATTQVQLSAFLHKYHE